jgi:hypothetical protein
VTQRPAELDPTVISQCGTLFAMRMANDRDHALLRSAVSETTANLLAFVPSLGTREALAVGVGISLPTRLTFAELPRDLIPRSQAVERNIGLRPSGHDLNFVTSVLEHWRSMTMSRNTTKIEMPREAAARTRSQSLQSAEKADRRPSRPTRRTAAPGPCPNESLTTRADLQPGF